MILRLVLYPFAALGLASCAPSDAEEDRRGPPAPLGGYELAQGQDAAGARPVAASMYRAAD